ncbi:MAG: hypothetical protein AAGC82_01145 [Pseudomonadota bacterium]
MSDRLQGPLTGRQGLLADPVDETPRRVWAIAALISLLWIGLFVAFLVIYGARDGALGLFISLMSALLPVGFIWVAASSFVALQGLRAEAGRLQRALQQISAAQVGIGPDVAQKLDAVLAAQRQIQAQVVGMTEPPANLSTSAVPAPDPAPRPQEEAQPSLSLGTPAEALDAPISTEEFIGALNFPENEHDAEGFAMLRKALRDRGTERLVRSSQDVLTLLSQDGIYMDDLRPDRARPEVWRAFARGDRGRAIAGLGGVNDRSSLALASGRMKQDAVFRDAVHHFLRAFDQTFMSFETRATDQDIIDLANTRTARAFMLLGRVTGTFD